MTSKAFELAKLGNAYSDGALSSRNMVTNGAMTVAQRSDALLNTFSNGFNTVDRWSDYLGGSSDHTFDVYQSTDAPEGFKYSRGIAVRSSSNTSTPVTTGYNFEGYDINRLDYGTANAKQSVVSFWVKSNVTGTYAIEVQARNASAYYTTVLNYTVNSSSTWEYKTISVPPLTTFTPYNNAERGLRFEFWLNDSNGAYSSGTATLGSWVSNGSIANNMRAAGQTANLLTNASGEWQLTGLQYEEGDTATPFEHEPYSVTLQKCMRYYEKFTFNANFGALRSGNGLSGTIPFSQIKRTTPSVSVTDSYEPFTANTVNKWYEGTVERAVSAVYITGKGFALNTTDTELAGWTGTGIATVDAEL